jgi:Ca2+-binding RTX toxin-like protein
VAIITGTNGDDLDAGKVKGTSGADELFGLAGRDELAGYGGNDRLDGGDGSDYLDGGAGSDWAVYPTPEDALLAFPVRVDLAAGFADQFLSRDQLRSIENARGGAGDDSLRGDAGVNDFRGAEGDDRLEGRGGADLLRGGSGRDAFAYEEFVDSAEGSGIDKIFDFSRQQKDRIDLSVLDADQAHGGDQTFEFRGKAGFDGAGEVRYVKTGGDTLVHVNADADAAPEMTIRLDDGVDLKASDFVL